VYSGGMSDRIQRTLECGVVMIGRLFAGRSSNPVMETAEVVICGAGMAGAAAAYHLAVRNRVPNVIIVDERPPMTLTSDKGTQGYRNWFDGPDDLMVRFVGRSIGIIEELAESSGNVFSLSRHGYAFVTADTGMREWLRDQARRLETFGAGAVREHPGKAAYEPVHGDDWHGIPDGADLLLDRALVQEHFSFLRGDAIAVSHVRRAGWMDAIRLGHWLLEEACRHGARIVRDRFVGIDAAGGRLSAVRLESGSSIPRGGLQLRPDPGCRPCSERSALICRCSSSCTRRCASTTGSVSCRDWRRSPSGTIRWASSIGARESGRGLRLTRVRDGCSTRSRAGCMCDR
jgi:hypothetical protein